MNILSYGGGLQSTALLHMTINGETDPLDAVIFADTHYEPSWVYETIERSRKACAAAGIPFYVVSGGDIKADALSDAHRFASMPLYTIMDGKAGMLRRQCTKEYKIRPIQRLIRSLTDHATLWIGISWDEVQRMKDSHVKYIAHRFPLVERRIRRSACETYLREHDIPVPRKSSCLCCPFHDDRYWSMLRAASPEEFADVAKFDADLRESSRKEIKGNAYLHRSLIPLSEIEYFRGELQHDMFADECDGVCGF